MTHLSDTYAAVAPSKRDPHVEARVQSNRTEDLAPSAIVSHELRFDAHRERQGALNLSHVTALSFDVLPFDVGDTGCAGELRAALAMAGRPTNPCDVRIAGPVLARDVRVSNRMPGSRVKNWDT